MHRRLPTILSILLLLLVLALFLFLRARTPLQAPQPSPSASAPAPADPPPGPQREDLEGLTGPGTIADALPEFRLCHARFAVDEGLESKLTLVFTVAVDPTAPRRLARVGQVRVRPEDEQLGLDATPFEGCIHQAVAGIELIAPGGRDRIDIPMVFELGG